MGISVENFIRLYKQNEKAKDKTFEEFINKHITTKYINFINKSVICDDIINITCHVKEGNREIVKINSPNRYLFFTMRLIESYTDIEFEKEKVLEAYDELNKIGAISTLIAAIPKAERSEFSTILNMKMDDFRDNEYSLKALLCNLKESLSISEEVINSVLQELQKETNND